MTTLTTLKAQLPLILEALNTLSTVSDAIIKIHEDEIGDDLNLRQTIDDFSDIDGVVDGVLSILGLVTRAIAILENKQPPTNSGAS